MKRPPGRQMLDRARSLRREKTEAEKLLWRHLRNRHLDGYKFREQMWLCGFIADFACIEGKLVVEADGGQHRFSAEYDAQRSRAFAAAGYRELRFWNDEILGDTDKVLGNIRGALALTLPPACGGRAQFQWTAPRAVQAMPGAWPTWNSRPLKGEGKRGLP